MGFFGRLFGKKPPEGPEHRQGQCSPEGYSPEQIPDNGGCESEHEAASGVSSHPEFETFEMQSASAQSDAVHTHTENITGQDEESAQICSDASREAYTGKYRAEFKHHFPTRLDTVESHMQLPYMVGAAVDISPVIEYASANVYERFREEPNKLSELSRAAVAKVAMYLENFIGAQEEGYFVSALARAHDDSLEKAWIVLDFYCRMLKAEYTQNISLLYGYITDELIKRSSNPVVQARSESYEDFLAYKKSLEEASL